MEKIFENEIKSSEGQLILPWNPNKSLNFERGP